MRDHLPCVCLSILLIAGTAACASAQQDTPPPAPPGIIDEPLAVSEAVELVAGFEPTATGARKDGFFPELDNMIAGAGWISVGPGYRHKFLDSRGFFETSAAVSWHAYTIGQARVEYRPQRDNRLVLGAQVLWQDATQIDYFGLGPRSSRGTRSQYRLQDVNAVGWARTTVKGVAITGTIGWLRRPAIKSPAGLFRPDYADTRGMFGEQGAPGITTPAGFLHGNISTSVDTRDAPLHPLHGGLYRVAWATYQDRDSGQSTFQRYEAEALQLVPLAPQHWTLALHGWIVGSDTKAGNIVPFYLMPTLGGQNTLLGYIDYRFHDRNLLLLGAESRWALMSHFDVAFLFGAGNVAPRIGNLNLRKTSTGAGLRVHSSTRTLGRLDIARSEDGWRVLFRLEDPLALSRLARRTATAPFVP